MLLPAQLRKRLKLDTGEKLICTVAEDGTMTVVPAKALAKKLKGCMNPTGVASHAVEDLLEERRREAKKETRQ